MPSLKPKSLDTAIIPIHEILFTGSKLKVPEYQRPYKWSVKNVNLLLDDILLNYKKKAYRLGTIVLHKKDGLNIVDGQQRLMTLTILAAELLRDRATEISAKLFQQDLALAQHTVTDPVSLRNLRRNHLLIKNRIGEFTEDKIEFFFHRCEVVRIILADISEAFQFFDAQNSRGKDLDPHDLLKAFHLREMSGLHENIIKDCVKGWENSADHLADFFSSYLYPVKRWSQGKSGINFSKSEVDIFKGVQLFRPEPFPYQSAYHIIHYTDKKGTDGKYLTRIDYPYQLDQVIVNGQRFFEFVSHYAKKIKEVNELSDLGNTENPYYLILQKGNPLALEIVQVLNSYRGRKRQGDLYLRNLFDCCLLYYRDRFGWEKIDEALIRFFYWVFALRLEKVAVQQVSVDALAFGEKGYFRIIREATDPTSFVHREMKPAKYIGDDNAVKDIEEIVELFKTQMLLGAK